MTISQGALRQDIKEHTQSTLRPSARNSPFSPVLQSNFVMKELSSSINGLTYQVMIQLPQSYQHNDSKTYPVLYALDAEIFFGVQVQTPFLLNFAGEIPEYIIVGPAYGETTADKILAARRRDYTPTVSAEFPGSGRANEFMQFILTDLMPLIDTSFRTTPGDRTLWGYSLGGLFALYVLFTEPEIFNRYLATSPFVLWDDEVIFSIEEAYASRRRDLPAHLFTSVGSLEKKDRYQKPWNKFMAHLRHRKYEGFDLKAVVIEGHTHFSVPAPSFVAGLMENTDFKTDPEHPQLILI